MDNQTKITMKRNLSNAGHFTVRVVSNYVLGGWILSVDSEELDKEGKTSEIRPCEKAKNTILKPIFATQQLAVSRLSRDSDSLSSKESTNDSHNTSDSSDSTDHAHTTDTTEAEEPKEPKESKEALNSSSSQKSSQNEKAVNDLNLSMARPITPTNYGVKKVRFESKHTSSSNTYHKHHKRPSSSHSNHHRKSDASQQVDNTGVYNYLMELWLQVELLILYYLLLCFPQSDYTTVSSSAGSSRHKRSVLGGSRSRSSHDAGIMQVTNDYVSYQKTVKMY